MSYYGYQPYVSVAAKKAKAAKKLKQLKKKLPNIKPVVIEGKALARTWWGKSWNKNLERYADYSNRVGRGRSYVRHGAVLDLQISTGKVNALVMGSTSKPYEVDIKIKSVSSSHWKFIKKQCEGQLRSLQDLLSGKFPKALGDIFFTKDKGLFPGPKEISFSCSCPDWASMCKHVAATLYGIGARFDEDPSLFFTLRGADTDELIARAVKDKTGKLLAKTKKKSARVITDPNLSDIFGIDMEGKPDFASKSTKNTPRLSVSSKKSRKGALDLTLKKNGKSKKSVMGDVAACILNSKKELSMQEIAEKTGYPKAKLYSIVQRLKQQGKIKNKSRGVYVKA